MTTATKTCDNFRALFTSLSAAIEAEDRILSAGREFLPECAQAVLDDRDAVSPEYYTWLCGQVERMDAEAEQGGITMSAEVHAAVTSSKTVLDIPLCPVCGLDEGCQECHCEGLQPPLEGFMFKPRLQHQPATEWSDLPNEGEAMLDADEPDSDGEDARLLAEVEKVYEEAKGTWTGREWFDGDKVTPESTDEQIAELLTRGEDIAITCWGIDPSDEVYRRRAQTALETLNLLWQREDCDEEFAAACNALRQLAEESDAGVAEQAKIAENAARKAMEYARAGERQNGYVLAWEAARIERQYGDAPTWGPFAEAVRAWSEHEAG